jgi:hypothetical protein
VIRRFRSGGRRATRGEYLEPAKQLVKRRRNNLRMSTEMRKVHERKPRGRQVATLAVGAQATVVQSTPVE